MVAGTETRPGIAALFEGLVPTEVVRAYERLLASNGCAKDQADSLVGDSGLVDELTSRGMAHIHPHTPVDPAWLRPASPDIALQGVLAGHQHTLARNQELLLDGHRRLADAQARYATTTSGRFPAHLVSAISDRTEVSELSASLMNTARQDWMTLENLHTDMPLTDDYAQPPLPALNGKVRCRSMYQTAVMDNTVARRIIRTGREAGEDIRLLPSIPMKMKLADYTTALIPITPTGTAGALLIKAPVIIEALRDYFELLWDRATPLLAHPVQLLPPGHPTRAQQKILELMAEGLDDAAIARRAEVSVTTVRRHITALLTRLNVTSRFAAGAAAQRHGWIG